MTIYAGPTGPGQFVQDDPRFMLPGGASAAAGPGGGFQDLLNRLKGAGTQGAKAVRDVLGSKAGQTAMAYAPAAMGVGTALGGDVITGGGQFGGAVLGSKLAGGLGTAAQAALSAAPNPIARAAAPVVGGAIRAGGGLLGAGLGGVIAGGAANAAQGVVGAVTGQRREEGKSGLTGGGVGEYSDKNMADLERLLRATQQNQVGTAQQMLPITNQFRDAEMQRQMQLNQQVGQLTGALNRQSYIAQLAGGAQSEAGATVRTMMTAANPYAASAFQYRG